MQQQGGNQEEGINSGKILGQALRYSFFTATTHLPPTRTTTHPPTPPPPPLPCSGKSTVGKIVGQALRYSFFDTDTLIQQLTGSTIPQIFEEDGEEAFRALETQVLHVSGKRVQGHSCGFCVS